MLDKYISIVLIYECGHRHIDIDKARNVISGNGGGRKMEYCGHEKAEILEKARKDMVECINKNGRGHDESIRLSVALDKLIAECQSTKIAEGRNRHNGHRYKN